MPKFLLFASFGLCLALSLSVGAGCAPDTGRGVPNVDETPDQDPGATPVDYDALPTSVDPNGAPQDMNCGGMMFGVTRVPPNVMLVLDRSGSMQQPISALNPQGPSKWQDLVTAIQTVITQYGTQIRFGLDLFADPAANGGGKNGSCNPGPIAVAVGAGNGPKIDATIAASSPGSQTPTATTLDLVIANGMLNDPTRDNIVVLATDGQPNCGDTDVTSRITRLYNLKPSVKTYVIGVGDDTAANPTLLDAWAVAGHTDRAGQTKYYQASSPADLTTAFTTIVGGVVSCSFQLAKQPPDPNQLFVWVNGKLLAADPTNGWSFSAMGPSVTLHGTACNQLKANPNTKVQVVYGCSQPPPS